MLSPVTLLGLKMENIFARKIAQTSQKLNSNLTHTLFIYFR